MTDITAIPDEELTADRRDALEDAGWCRLALALGVPSEAMTPPIRERLDGNLRQVAVIDAEILRRRGP